MPIGDLNAVPKPGKSTRVKLTQKQRGDINDAADTALRQRSRGVCELCGNAWATERAHLTGRKHIDHKTTAADLAHLCLPCHDWLDETPEGIRARRFLAMMINYALKQEAGG